MAQTLDDLLRYIANPPPGDPSLTASSDQFSGSMPINSLGGVAGFFVDFSTGSPGLPVTLNEARSTAPFDGQTITPTGGAAMTYSDSVVLPPMTRSMKITTTQTAFAYLTLSALGRLAYTTYGRLYVYRTGNTLDHWRPVWWYYANTAGGFTPAGAIRITIAGHVSILAGGGSPSQLAVSTTALADNTWYRLEWGVTRETLAADGTLGNNGVCTVQIFTGHSTTPIETIVTPGFHTGPHLDLIQFGSANNSNLGTGGVYVAGFADGCKSAVGPYTGPPAGALTASSADGSQFDGGFNHAGEFLVTIKEKFTGNGNNYQYQPGQQGFLVNRWAELIGGPSLNGKESDPSTTLPDFMFSLTSGRLYSRSQNVAENDDPPDTTYMRFANVPNPIGTDGNWDGNVFSAPSMSAIPTLPNATRQTYGGFQTVHTNCAITINGTVYFITSVVNPSRVTLANANGDPLASGGLPLNTNNLSWTLPLNPYTPQLYPGGGALFEVRSAPAGRVFVRASPASGAADASTTSGSTALSSPAGIQFTAQDATRLICLNNDPTQVYKLAQINSATSATLDLPATATLTNVAWSIASGDYEAALPLPFNPSSYGVTNHSGYAAQFAPDASKGFCPVDHTWEAAGAAFYSGASDLTTPPTALALRGVTGNLEPLNRISLGTTASPKTETTDTQIYRSAASRETHTGLIDATALSVAIKVKAGAPVDGDWASAPPVGTLVLDTTNSKLWARTGVATWKGVVIA